MFFIVLSGFPCGTFSVAPVGLGSITYTDFVKWFVLLMVEISLYGWARYSAQRGQDFTNMFQL